MNDQPSPGAAQRASGTELLTLGLTVGVVGVAGAALGAVCPLCVVATPTLLGLGAIQKLRGWVLGRRATVSPACAPPPAAPR